MYIPFSLPALAALITLSGFTSAMRFASFNLRFDSKPDNITVQQSIDSLPDPLVQFKFLNITQEQPWSTRRLRTAELLLSEGIVLAGE